MINIGFDFDNTIISYDNLFYELAKDIITLPSEIKKDKNSIRNFFLQSNQEVQFTILQGLVYGKEIMRATPTKNFLLILEKLCKLQNVKIFIVSHKTKYPYKGEKINLRSAATNWIENNLKIDGKLCINPNNIFYESTIEEKIDRIKQLKCNLFIDDLPSVIFKLKKGTTPILYDPYDNFSKLKIDIISNWLDLEKKIFEN